MATKKVGTLIKEARTNAGLTQEQLARKISGLSANDISRAERGEKDLTQEQLKSIARITGVTQKSLLDAARGTSSGKTSGKTSSTSSRTGTSVKVTATEKKFLELYRNATTKDRSLAKTILGGDYDLKDILFFMMGQKVTGSRTVKAGDLLNLRDIPVNLMNQEPEEDDEEDFIPLTAPADVKVTDLLTSLLQNYSGK